MPVRLFVGNLPYDATEEDIRAHFSTAGTVVNVFIPLDRETGRKRGFAFVEFNEAAEAQEAIRVLNNQPFGGRPLAVNEARAKERRPPSSGGGFRPGPPRPSSPGFRSPGPRGPAASRPGFDQADPGAPEGGGRGDKHSRKFGPDAKPFRNRSQKSFRPEGGKRALKERMSGQLYSMDDEEEDYNEPDIDNFAVGLDENDTPEENP